LIEGVEFGALLADKAFDSDWIVAQLNERGAQIVISQHPRRSAPLAIDIQSPSPHRKLLRQTQGVQADRPSRQQNRSKLHSHDPPRRRTHQFAMNLNKP
jgi:hypothetical protein